MHTLNILSIAITALLVVLNIRQLRSIMKMRKSLMAFIHLFMEDLPTEVLRHVRDDPGFEKAMRKIASSIIVERIEKGTIKI